MPIAPALRALSHSATLIATRLIRRGEEVYASYGESYWRARGIDPETGVALPAEEKKQSSKY